MWKNFKLIQENFEKEISGAGSAFSELKSRSLDPSILTLFPPLTQGHCATSEQSSYAKNGNNLFYHKLDAEYFFVYHFFFEKNSIFRENSEKLRRGHMSPFFSQRRYLAPKINLNFFYRKLGTAYFFPEKEHLRP